MDGGVEEKNQPASSILHEAARALARQLAKDEATAPTVIDRIRARRVRSKTPRNPIFGRLARIGLTHDVIIMALQSTKTTGASVVDELIAQGKLRTSDYFRQMADDFGVEYCESISPDKILTDMLPTLVKHGNVYQLFCRDEHGVAVLFTAPAGAGEAALAQMIARDPTARQRVCITCPATIKTALAARFAKDEVLRAVNQLNAEQPTLSAKQTLTPMQGFLLGLFVVALPLSLAIAFWKVLLGLHIFASLFFMCAVALRFMAWWTYCKPPPVLCGNDQHSNFPRYSVMIALHKEAPVVPQLVEAMGALEWPKSKLEVFYVCEEDDFETIAALNDYGLPPGHAIMPVPFALPRTKPKALTYTLPHCTGEFIVIYDAEDRPNPVQLKEAWYEFSRSDITLACLQAPLVISNSGHSWWSRLFAFEYAAHFYGLLPFLVRIGAPLPLGGTSNHFRREALVHSLAWDPYNVTEDADLGIRFSRMGYRCGVITKPTLEDAPTDFKVWLPQRTRWQKGWMQTLLVHNRESRQLYNALGLRDFVVFQIVLLGFITSPLLYVISVFELSTLMFMRSENNLEIDLILAMDAVLFVCGHVGFYCLATRCEAKQSMREHLKMLLSLPVYWIFLSRAAWRAVWQLIFKPHLWEKTPHLPAVNSEVLDLGQ